MLRLQGLAGAALPSDLRGRFERGLGVGLGDVRLHTGAVAAAAASALGARAVTVGSNVAFGAGQYAPATRAGQHLLAHEVTHAVQQRRGKALAPTQRVARRDALTELEADLAADALIEGRPFTIAGAAPVGPALQVHAAPPAAATDTLPTSQLGEIALQRVEALAVYEPRLTAGVIDPLRAELLAAPAAGDDLRTRIQLLLDVLSSAEPAFTLAQPLVTAEYLAPLQTTIVARASQIRLRLATAVFRAYRGERRLAQNLLERAGHDLDEFPAFLREQYLGDQGVGRLIRDLTPLRQGLLDMRGRNHRAPRERAADALIGLDDPDSQLFPRRFQRIRESLRRQGDQAATATTVGFSLRDLLVDIGTVTTLMNLLAVYEQFEFYHQQLNAGLVAQAVDLYRSQDAVAVSIQGRLAAVITEFEAIPHPTTFPPDAQYYADFATAVGHANALLSSPDIENARLSIEARLGTIATVNLIGRVVLITAAAIVTGAAAGELVGAGLARLGAGVAVRGTAAFLADVTTFTFVNRVATHTLIGPPPAGTDPGFGTELLQNAVMFGALRGIGAGLRAGFRVTETSSLAARAALRVGTATVSGLVMQGFAEAQHALGPAGAMTGEERYRSILQNVGMIAALELGRVVTEPITASIVGQIRASVHRDLIRQADALAATRTELQPRLEALRRGAIADDDVAQLLLDLQALLDGELRLLDASVRRGLITQASAAQGIAQYNALLASLELRLSRAGVAMSVRSGAPVFRLVRLGVVAYSPDGLAVLNGFYARPGYTLTPRPGGVEGELVGRSPAGEVTNYVPEGSLPAAAPTAEAVAAALGRAEALVAGDELAADGLARLNQIGFGARSVSEMLATFGNEAELIDFLRFVGRNPGGFSTSSSALLRGIGAVPEAVAFGRRFGVRVLASFWRRFAGADAENRAAALRATTAYLGDPSVTPEVRAQRLAQLEVLTSRLEFERAIGTAPPPVPRPPRPNATTLGIDRNAAEWDTLHTEEADLAQRRGLTLTDAELATWADLQQIFSRARRGDFIGLGRDALLRILDEYERRAVDARMPRLLINARRGRLAELFFGPRPARPQQAYLGGVPVPYSTAGASRPDYWITPEEAVTAGEPPRAFTEFVDLKSDLINSGTVRAGDRAYTAGVRAATQYVGHAAADQPNLPAGARISLDFVRSTNPATTRAMLDILFTASSRIYRVRFGGGAWQTNPHYVPP